MITQMFVQKLGGGGGIKVKIYAKISTDILRKS